MSEADRDLETRRHQLTADERARGGETLHRLGLAYVWTRDAAAEAGRKSAAQRGHLRMKGQTE